MSALKKDLHILVVEDNPGDYVLIEEYLNEAMENPIITHVKTFAELEGELNKGSSLDGILLDLSLPDLSGEPLVEKVIALSGPIPVVVLTGYENQDFGLKTLSMGVADFLLKDEITPFMLAKVIAYSIERNNIKQSLQRSEKKYREIFNLSPQPMFLIDVEKRTIVDVNEAAVTQYGYTKEEFKDLHLKDIRPEESIPLFKEQLKRIDNSNDQFYHTKVKHRRKNGEVFDVDLSTSEIIINDKRMRMALAEDVTEKVEAEQNIRNKSDLLTANAKITSALIKNEDWMSALNETFEAVGTAVNVDRVYYFENHTDPETGERLTSQLIEWSSDKVESQIDNSEMQNIKMNDFQEHFPKLAKAEIYQSIVKNVKHRKLKAIFEDQEIVSVLHFPIIVDNKFHGFIGFDDCSKERIWTDEEIQYLETLGSNISGAIKLRKTTQELERRERRFKALVQEGSDLIAILDEEFRFKYVSPSIGSDHDSYHGMKAIDTIHPDDVDQIKESLKALENEKRVVLKPYRLKDQKDQYHWVETVITNLLDEPAVNGYIANSRNVTSQIKREQKLKELSLVASKTNDLVVITDENGCITWVNNAFEDLTLYSLEEIKGEKPGDFLQGEDTDPEVVERLSVAIENRKAIEETILNYNKKGESYWLNMRIDPIFDEEGKCINFIAIERDVTEKIQNEKEIRESLERYDIVNKATSDTIWDLDLKTDTILYNSNIYNMFGYDKTEVKKVRKWWREKIHPEDIEKVEKILSDILKNGKERFQIQYRFRAADGSYKHVLDRAFLIKDASGTIVRMIGAMQDVTHEVEEEERLKLLESVITNTKETVVITEAEPSDLPGRKILFVNEAFEELTGYDKEYAVGKTLDFLNGPKTDKKARKRLLRSMEKYEANEAEFINYKKNGEQYWVNISMVPVADNQGNYTHWVFIGRDVTEERKYQEEIKASLNEKETLLAEIHHRVKNNLAVVSGMMQLQAFDTENEDLQEKLYDSVVRIKTMATVHELLYQSNSFSKLEFSETLKKLVENISETLQPDNRIELDICCAPLTLNINQAIPASLIVNEVITNAYKHAFKDLKKGKITFSLEEIDHRVKIEIKDNGKGIDEDKLAGVGSLGIHLIQVLTDQINGESGYHKQENGTKFSLTFERLEQKGGIGNAKLG